MTQPQQAAANALGGYVVGRMEGRNGNGNNGGGFGRIPGKRALSRYLEYQKGAYGAHLEYLGQYNLMSRSNAMLEHQLGQQAADAQSVRDAAFENLTHQNATSQADQAHVHSTEAAEQAQRHNVETLKVNANNNKSQMRAAAKIAQPLQDAGVKTFNHTPEGGVGMEFHPPAKKAPAKKAPAKKAPANPKPPANPTP